MGGASSIDGVIDSREILKAVRFPMVAGRRGRRCGEEYGGGLAGVIGRPGASFLWWRAGVTNLRGGTVVPLTLCCSAVPFVMLDDEYVNWLDESFDARYCEYLDL